MSDAKRHTRFIEEDLVEARPKGPPPSPLQSTSQKLSGVEEQSASPPSRFPAKRTQKRTGGGLVPVLAGSPWKHYENRHRLKFGHSFAVVTSTITRRPRMIRSITGPSSDEQIHRLRHLFHPNIVESLKLYTCPQEGYFLVSEFLPTTLEHLYQAPIYPTEPELGSILHQVLTGINFLLTSGLVYEQVSAANLLVSYDGKIKICDVERCTPDGDISKLLDSFIRLMMKLMDKEKRGDGVAGLTRPDRWSHEAIDMFTEAVSKPSVKHLLEHPFLHKREEKDLEWLVYFVLIRARHPPD